MIKITMAITTQAATKVLVDIESSPIGYLIERSEQKNPRRNGVKCFFLNNTNNMIRIRKLATFMNIVVRFEVNLFNIVLGTTLFSHSLDSEAELLFLTLFISVELSFKLLKLFECPFMMICSLLFSDVERLFCRDVMFVTLK